MKINTPIVIVAYNRARSLKRLLRSIESASYPNSEIELIISIDFASDNKDVLEIANKFQWNHGKKTVNYQEKNLGLRKHILKCGDLSLKYGSVIVVEDDLFVSPNFYNYTTSALNFCEENGHHIGGISLYNHQLNVHTRSNFIAMEDGYDNWYFQFASSWGQAWNATQWKEFMEWYQAKPVIDDDIRIPEYVRSWSEKSWLKYNIAYLIDRNKFFLYPKISLSTNFSDAGTHVGNDSSVYQVPLLNHVKKDYNFSRVEESGSIYDAFYENCNLAKYLDLGSRDVTIDLNGYDQKIETRYLLSSRILDFKIVKSFAKSLKPIDANIRWDLPGNDFFLYDTSIEVQNKHRKNNFREITYNHKQIHPSDGLYVYSKFWKDRFRKLLSKFGI